MIKPRHILILITIAILFIVRGLQLVYYAGEDAGRREKQWLADQYYAAAQDLIASEHSMEDSFLRVTKVAQDCIDERNGYQIGESIGASWLGEKAMYLDCAALRKEDLSQYAHAYCKDETGAVYDLKSSSTTDTK